MAAVIIITHSFSLNIDKKNLLREAVGFFFLFFFLIRQEATRADKFGAERRGPLGCLEKKKVICEIIS